MKKSIVPQASGQESVIKILKSAIARKKKILLSLTEKVEVLKMELDTIQEIYNARIGYLYIKDNKLDLEIIKHKMIADFVAAGFTLKEATKKFEDSYYGALLESETFTEFAFEKQVVENMAKTKNISADVKQLWKKLVRKFHPDLVTDPVEKEKREKLIKKINIAYKDEDLETLKNIEGNILTEERQDDSLESLQKTLVDIENAIIKAHDTLRDLNKSQWYQWKIRLKKAQKTNIDIFVELERTILDDIGRKIDILHAIQSKLGQMPIQ